MTALVSLIMPAWNPYEPWLRQAVASALADEACDLELIVVDDGSAVPVAATLDDVGDDRLRIIRSDHVGPYLARNAALAVARGTHVRFVDADDVVEPGTTSGLLAAVGDWPDVVSYGATMMCDEGLRDLKLHTSLIEGDAVEACLLGEFTVFHVSMLFPRSVIDQAGGWPVVPFPVSGDWDFVLRALEHASVRRLDGVMTRYRRHGASVTGQSDVTKGGVARTLVVDRYFERHPAQRGTSLERRARGRLHLDQASAHAWQGQRRLAAEHLVRAVRFQPVGAGQTVLRLAVDRARRLRKAATP